MDEESLVKFRGAAKGRTGEKPTEEQKDISLKKGGGGLGSGRRLGIEINKSQYSWDESREK